MAEDREKLIVYGGNGQAARNPKALNDIINALKNLENNQTLLVQSGKPVAVVPSHENGPRVLIANSNLVPKWGDWDYFNDLKDRVPNDVWSDDCRLMDLHWLPRDSSRYI